VLVRAVADVLALADAVVLARTFQRQVTDGVTVVDTAVTAAAFFVVVADEVVFADAATAAFQGALPIVVPQDLKFVVGAGPVSIAVVAVRSSEQVAGARSVQQVPGMPRVERFGA
jgi:hypothetical protein